MKPERSPLLERIGTCFALAFSLSLAAAAAPPPSLPSRFGEQVDVRVVNLEVVVTDKAGHRVEGLKPGDLRLTVDGRPTPVEFFTEVRGGQAVAGEAGAQPAVPALASLAPGDAVGTSYLVYVDDRLSLRIRRDEVLRALKADLGRLGPADRMAVVAYDGRQLVRLADWTQDAEELGRAFDAALDQRSHGIERIGALQASRDIDRATDSAPTFADPIVWSDATPEIQSATLALRTFAAPPGRKVMLLLSGGWPFHFVDSGWVFERRPPEPDFPRFLGGERQLAPLVDTANRLGWTLYPVDVPGAVGFDEATEGARATLLYLANETGGQAQLAGMRTAALKNAAADTRSYYWLGFTPSWKGNDERHRIEVKAARSGLVARSRTDFLDLSRQSEVSYKVESAVLFGLPPGSSSFGLSVELGKPRKAKRGEMALPVTLAIPVSVVTPVPEQGEYVTELEVRVAARDKNGDRSDLTVLPVRFTTPQAPPAGQYFKFQTTLELRRIQQRLVLSVYDPLSDRVTTVEKDVAVP